jgi:hypothetical protein
LNHKRLKQELKDFALVAFKQDEFYYSSKQRGIAPLVALCEMKMSKDELYLADKVIGKAAALLCVKCGVTVLYAKVVSGAALDVLQQYDIDVAYDTLVPYIRNRERNGKCPMEKLAHGVTEPEQMLVRAQGFLKSMTS